jgi:hypothetical protein
VAPGVLLVRLIGRIEHLLDNVRLIFVCMWNLQERLLNEARRSGPSKSQCKREGTEHDERSG